MSVRYEIVRLLAWLGVALGLALGLAAITAVVHGGGYLSSPEICCYVFGALMLLLGAADNPPGRGSGLDVESGLAGSSARRTVAVTRRMRRPNTLAPAVPFGIVLIVLGVAPPYDG